MDYLVLNVHNYVDNYRKIMKKVDNFGKFVLKEKETYFLSTGEGQAYITEYKCTRICF